MTERQFRHPYSAEALWRVIEPMIPTKHRNRAFDAIGMLAMRDRAIEDALDPLVTTRISGRGQIITFQKDSAGDTGVITMSPAGALSAVSVITRTITGDGGTISFQGGNVTMSPGGALSAVAVLTTSISGDGDTISFQGGSATLSPAGAFSAISVTTNTLNSGGSTLSVQGGNVTISSAGAFSAISVTTNTLNSGGSTLSVQGGNITMSAAGSISAQSVVTNTINSGGSTLSFQSGNITMSSAGSLSAVSATIGTLNVTTSASLPGTLSFTNLTVSGTLTATTVSGGGGTISFQGGNITMSAAGALSCQSLVTSTIAGLSSLSVSGVTSSGSFSGGSMSLGGGLNCAGIVSTSTNYLYHGTSSTDTPNVFINAFTGEVVRYTSSARYKTDIEHVETAPVLQLIARRWHSRLHEGDLGGGDDPERWAYGWIAEEAAEADPRFATYGEDGLPNGVNLYAIVSALADQVRVLASRP